MQVEVGEYKSRDKKAAWPESALEIKMEELHKKNNNKQEKNKNQAVIFLKAKSPEKETKIEHDYCHGYEVQFPMR